MCSTSINSTIPCTEDQECLEVDVRLPRTVLPEQAEILQDVEHATHLTEDEDSRSFRPEGTKEFVKDDHLSRVINEMLVSGVGRSGFLRRKVRKGVDRSIPTYCAIKQVWVACDFAKLHDHIHQAGLSFLFASETCNGMSIGCIKARGWANH